MGGLVEIQEVVQGNAGAVGLVVWMRFVPLSPNNARDNHRGFLCKTV
jgi:hypothetical protein